MTDRKAQESEDVGPVLRQLVQRFQMEGLGRAAQLIENAADELQRLRYENADSPAPAESVAAFVEYYHKVEAAIAATRSRPRLLDLFCCSGGATRGYQNAGFHVTGVDINPQPNYCGDEFIQGDALEILHSFGDDFDVIHASPPCQASSALTKGTNKGRIYPQLISETREVLRWIGKPWIMENVQGSSLRRDLTLCGEMFGLAVIRHRYFEVEGFRATQPAHQPHRGRVAGMRHGVWYQGPYFAVYGDGGGKGTVAQWREAMGIDWTWDRKEIAEAIPPAYTFLIGAQLLQSLERAA